ncbi:Ribonuclease HII [Candidatus Calditenuaceae archaeon HR02]|nr:Ribonuclease HII [Candidatus Calditenuaceae archaeon HR02]
MSRLSRVVGVDEAGRGAVIGPLVVAGIAVSEDMIPRLEEAGVKDSKKLTRKRREELYKWLTSTGVENRFELIEPERVDIYTRRRGGPGINTLEIEAIVSLAEVLRPDVMIVDSPSKNTESIRSKISQHLAGVRVICQCHADEEYPVVAAASIVAKVIRDAALSDLAKTLGDIGSGYPSDPRTLAFLHRLVRQKGLTDVVRRSWRTVDRVMPTLGEYLGLEDSSGEG